jgi:myo-inositol-1-phosphate synthase
MTHDGLGKYLSQVIEKAPGETADIVKLLKDSKADVLVSYLPVGSEEATKWYVEQALAAGVAFVNNIPVFIAREAYWAKRFKQAGLPIIGDDIKSQVGATIMHRSLATLYEDRGVKLERTYQLNVGGNTDFLNMLERERLESKKISKTNAVTSQIPHDMGADNVHIGPSDHVPWLTDRKWAYIRLEGRAFGDVPLTAEVKLEVWDSPNSAGIVIDAVRLIKLALDNGLSGPLEWPSAYLMKSPPVQHRDELAREEVEAFIKKYGKKGSTRSTAAKKPASRTAAKKPAVRKPAAKKPAARTAAAAKPATRAAKPAAKKPATRTTAKPVAKKVVAKKPAARTAARPAAKKVVAKKPATRTAARPAAKKPAVRKPAAKKR